VIDLEIARHGAGMIRGHLATTGRFALGFVVSVAAFGTLGACGGRYELGKDEGSGGKAGAGSGGPMTGGTGGDGVGGTTGGTGGKGGSGTGGASGGGGDGAMGGNGNAGGEPSGFVSQISARSNKLDLLLMIDNSISMGEKQRLLAAALPHLLRRLTTPDCVDENGAPLGGSSTELGECAEGAPEFTPVTDIHVGVITSSLGDHGSGDICSEASASPDRNYNDRAELLPNVRALESSSDLGFLAWGPSGTPDYSGYTNPAELAAAVSDHVLAAGETGCGFEASLESWYRFLIDPQPVRSMLHGIDSQSGADRSIRGPVNEAILVQRASFLRPDSHVAIMMLSDENDCSILDEDGTQGWLVPFKGGVQANNWRMPRATSACAADPNSSDCTYCSQITEGDPACTALGNDLTLQEDAPNLRCFRQKQRFGVDFLYPTNRYVEALTSPTIDPRLTGDTASNPLFAGGARGPASVVLMGMIGVPWQDLARNPTATGGPIEYMTASELVENERWGLILESEQRLPLDLLMLESVDPRPAGTLHPLLHEAAAVIDPDDATGWNAINGREQRVIPSERADLQFACIFPLAEPIGCTMENEGPCECNDDEFAKNSPLCDYEGGDSRAGIQRYEKAYPGVRQLEVLRDLGDSGVTTSICPQPLPSLDFEPGPGWWYQPNMDALVERMKGWFGQQCLPRPLVVESNGQVACRISEASFDSCDCSGPGRSNATSADHAVIKDWLESVGVCSAGTGCDALCACELAQFQDDDLSTCQNDPATPEDMYGFCYVDPAAGAGTPALVQGCRDNQKRRLRFMGEDVPAAGKLTMIVCDPE
jgi:hypothetical protein